MPAVADDMQSLARKLVEPLRGWFLGYGSGYVSGTWTPVFAGSGTAGSFTYDRQTGIYRRVGDLVYVAARLRISGITSGATGALLMTGIPFTALTTGVLPGYTLAVGFYTSLNLAANTVQAVAYVDATSDVIALQEAYDNAANTGIDSALLSVGTDVQLAGWYVTDTI